MAGITLLDTKVQIRERIKEAAIKHFSTFFTKNRTLIKAYIQDLLVTTIKKSPEWQSMENGSTFFSLRSQFGFKNASVYLDPILTYLQNNLTINVDVPKNNILLSVGLTAIPNDGGTYNTLLNLNTANYASNNNPKKIVFWLKWLLLSGGQDVVKGWAITTPDKKRKRVSRSGLSIMTRIKDLNYNVEWNLSLTSQDNFLTRVSSSMEPELKQYFKDILQNS